MYSFPILDANNTQKSKEIFLPLLAIDSNKNAYYHMKHIFLYGRDTCATFAVKMVKGTAV
jgi:hypothetical protein